MFGKSSRRNGRSSSICGNMESLEVRRVPVGNITAALQNGVLTITGDNAANDVEVSRRFVGAVTIAGLNQTLVNGQAPVNGRSTVTFNNVKDVVINTNDGNDNVVVKGLGISARFRDITIDTGAGDDIVDLQRVIATDDINVVTKNGKDRVNLDVVEVGGLGVDDNKNDLNINTARVNSDAPDNDTVLFRDVKVKRDVSIVTGADADNVVLRDRLFFVPFRQADAKATVVGDDLSIDSGDGDDNVTLTVVNVVDSINIELRGGNDRLRVEKSTAANFNADGGSGQDTLILIDNLFGSFDEDNFEL